MGAKTYLQFKVYYEGPEAAVRRVNRLRTRESGNKLKKEIFGFTEGISNEDPVFTGETYCSFNVEYEGHKDILRSFCGTPALIRSNPDVQFEIKCAYELHTEVSLPGYHAAGPSPECGEEGFSYRNGNLLAQWFEVHIEIVEPPFWTPCAISWKGPHSAVEALRTDIIRETKDGLDNLLLKTEQHWKGRHLHFDRYYDENGPEAFFRCSVLDGEIKDNFVSFDAYGEVTENDPSKLVSLFNGLAQAHSEIDFEMKMCPGRYNSMASPVWAKTFIYHKGLCISETRSDELNDFFVTCIPDYHFRYGDEIPF